MVAFRIVTLTPEQLCRLNSTIWAHHHIIAAWFVFVSYCSVSLFCVLVIMVLAYVSKVTNMTCNLLWTGQEVTACILHTGTKLCTSRYLQTLGKLQLAFPWENQITTVCILLTKLPASSWHRPSHSLHPSDESQITVYILLTLQSVSSKQEPSNGLWTPGRN